MDILLMGPPGAGKGTQGAILSDALGLPKFATGDLLRDAVKRGTPLGLQAKAAMEAPVKLIGPLMIFIFPITFIVIGFPIVVKYMTSGMM